MKKLTPAWFACLAGISFVCAAHALQLAATAPPIISGFSPTSGPPGTAVEIRGTNFAGVTAVQFNGVNARFSYFGGLLIATVPTNAFGGPITVITPVGQATSTESFVVTAPGQPAITAFTPASGEPGTTVQISGQNLTGATSVQFNGINAEFNMFGDLLLATVPASATTGPITVTTPTGTAISQQAFTVELPSGPSITEISPNAGEPGTVVKIDGTNLSDATSVQFNGVDATFTSLAGSLFATVPATASTGPITVITPAGAIVSTIIFTVTELQPPVITSFSPTSGPAGTSVEILGTNLRNVQAVRFAGTTAVFTNIVSGVVNAVVPVNAVTGPITVVTPAGSATSVEPFTVVDLAAPTITGITPTSGPPGTEVFIQGQNLTNVISVRFQGAGADFVEFGPNLVQTVVPTGATTGPITVVTPTGEAQSPTFTVQSGPGPGTGPQLTARVASPTEFELSWPVDLTPFSIQASSDLGNPQGWTTLQVTPSIVEGRNVARIPLGTGAQFFRLRSP